MPTKRQAKRKGPGTVGAGTRRGMGVAPESLRDGKLDALQELIGISRTTLVKLSKDGVFRQLPGPRGHYNLGECVRAYLAYKTAGGIESDRAKKTQQETRKLKLLNDEREGRLIRIEHASRLFSEFASAIRAGVAALPGRLSAELAGKKKASEIRAIIHGEVTSLLAAAEEIFGGLQAEPETEGDSGSGIVDIEAAAESNTGRVGGSKSSPPRRKRRAREVA